MRVSFPLYNIPEMHAAFRAFWHRLRALAAERGVAGLPEEPDQSAPAVPDRIGGEVAFTQVCGFPLMTRLGGQAKFLMTPVYDAPGCAGPTHTAFFVVRADATFRTLEDLRGRMIAFNSVMSNSGMNLPRRAIAAIAGGKPFFGRRLITGSQAASVEAVVKGDADVATIDCVTDAVLRRHRPEFMQGIRVLAECARSPSLPFVTSAETSECDAEILRHCLAALPRTPDGAVACQGLLIRDFVRLSEDDYKPVIEHRDEAIRLGYPELV